MPGEIDKLKQAMAALEAQRSVLGDSVVNTALGPLSEKLQALLAAQDADPAADESQQRKILTVLFADLPALATLGARMDEEDIQGMMSSLWPRLDQAILDYGGRIDKHMGNAVMALWGADSVAEDDPEQAVRAALALQQVVKESQGQFPDALEEVTLRAGLNTGAAIVGLVGTTSEFTAIGDTVNLAARLNQAAQPGQLLISSDTFRRVRGIFDVTPQPPLIIKGKAEPILAYSVERAKPRAFYYLSRGADGFETSLVGRETELAAMQEVYHSLFAEPRAQSLTVVGDTGLGKSRLLQEFLAWTDLRDEDYWLFQGGSSPSMTGSPYAFLRDLFAFRFEIQDNDTLSEVQRKMEAGFARFMPEDTEPQEKAHVIGQMIGFDFSASPYLRGLLDDPRQLRNLGLSYLVRFFQSAAKIHPVILLLDDIHWADDGSLEVLRHLLLNTSRPTPLAAIMMARPSFYERLPEWEQGLPAHTRMDLRPLSRDESREMVQQILRHVTLLPSALRELIVGGAEGNPFYLEELVKMLIDGRVILPGAAEWTVNMDRLDTVSIPPTLAGVLQARLDALDGLERASLQRASVVGRVFWDRAIHALGVEKETERERLNQSLQVLRRKELIFNNPDSTFSGTLEFSFKHALLRDVTYETLLKRQRVEYHARAAEWLNEVSGERRAEYLPVIAEHYEKAGMHDQAAKALMEAGDQALSISAFNDAFRFFRQALSYLPKHQLRDLTYIQLKIGEVFMRSGELVDALKYSEGAMHSSKDLTGSSLQTMSMYQVGQVYAEMGDYPMAEKLFSQALPMARSLGNSGQDILARVLFGLGNLYWRLGRLEEARNYCQESYELSKKVGENNTMLLALNRLGVLSGSLGDPQTEEALYKEVHSLAVTLGNRERAGVALNNLGALADEKGELEKAQQYYLQAINLAREIGVQQSLALYLINLAHSEIRLGQLDAGQEHLREGMALAHHVGAAPWTLTAVLFYARLEAARGKMEHALQILAMVAEHPAYSADHQRLAEQMLSGWGLSPQAVEQAQGAASPITFQSVLSEFLAV